MTADMCELSLKVELLSPLTNAERSEIAASVEVAIGGVCMGFDFVIGRVVPSSHRYLLGGLNDRSRNNDNMMIRATPPMPFIW